MEYTDLPKIKRLYEKYKHQARCIDVEVDGKRNLVVVGIYTPKDGEIDYIPLVRDKNLTRKALKEALEGAKLLIFFNGKGLDIPGINRYAPTALPTVPVLDLYDLARALNLRTGLKTLEQHFDIFRRDLALSKKRSAGVLWRAWKYKKNQKSLDQLISYNREDTINMYPLAEYLMKKITSDPGKQPNLQ